MVRVGIPKIAGGDILAKAIQVPLKGEAMSDGVQKVVIQGAAKKHSFPLNRDAHTVLIDVQAREQAAVEDFLKIVVAEAATNLISKDELFGAALGYFGVKLSELYPELSDRYELNDNTLAALVRWQRKREIADTEEEKQSELDGLVHWNKTVSAWAMEQHRGTTAWSNLVCDAGSGNKKSQAMMTAALEYVGKD